MFGGTTTETKLLSVNTGPRASQGVPATHFVFLSQEREMELEYDHLIHIYKSYFFVGFS